MSQSLLSYQEVLSALARHVGLDAQELLSTEEIVVDGLPIGLQLDGEDWVGDLLFFSVLGTPVPEQLQRIMRTMLEANYFWIGTGGCTLGLQQDTGAVTLCGRIHLDELSGETLAALLDGFADTAAFWRSFVEGKPEAGDLASLPAFQFHQRA
jgi:hypothetical protein